MTSSRFRWLAAAALLLAACPEAKDLRSAAATERPDVVLVSWDTVRWDHVGAGPRGGASATPTLDRFAREGVAFTEARTTAPLTLTAHASILTGLQPPRHGARSNGSFKVRGTVSTLAEEFRAAGYATAAFVSAAVLHRRYGLARGFEQYDTYMQEDAGSLIMTRRTAGDTVATARAWLESAAADPRPIFLWLHLFDPHRPWEAPEPWLERFGPYRAEISYADAQTARLLDYLRGIGRLSKTVLVMTADHGEGLGDHGEVSHSMLAYDSTLRVPLVLWAGPRAGVELAPGARIDGLVSLVDIAPTLRELAGLPPRPTDGISLASHLAGRPLPDREIPFETVAPAYGLAAAPVFGVATSDGDVWIDLPSRERYDVRRDPQQLANLYTAADAATADAIFARFPRDWPPSDTPLALDDAARRRLEALGYVVRPGASTQRGANVDPKDRLPVFQFVTADHSLQSPRRVLAKMQALRAEHGPLPLLVEYEVLLLQALARHRDALEVAREAFEKYPDNPGFRGDFKELSRQFEQVEQSLRSVRLRLAREPENTHLRLVLATLLRRSQDLEGEVAIYREILATEPDNREAQLFLAAALTYLERDDEALAQIRAFRAKPGYDAKVDCALGDLLASHLERVAEARAAFRDCAAGGVALKARQRAVLDPAFTVPPLD